MCSNTSNSAEFQLLNSGYGQGIWPLRERLVLASLVCNPDNQQLTWSLVQKRISQYTPPGRDSTWCSARNCSKQYAAMLDAADSAKLALVQKLKSDPGSPDAIFLNLSSSDFLLRKLIIQRLDELRNEISKAKSRNDFLSKLRNSIHNNEFSSEESLSFLNLLKNKCVSHPPETRIEKLAGEFLEFTTNDDYPDDTWTANFKKLGSLPLSSTSRHSFNANQATSVATLMSAASNRKLPSSLATTSNTFVTKQNGRSQANKICRTRGRPRTDTLYQTNAKIKASSSRRETFYGQRDHAPIDIYIEQDENEDSFVESSENYSDSESTVANSWSEDDNDNPPTPSTIPMSTGDLEDFSEIEVPPLPDLEIHKVSPILKMEVTEELPVLSPSSDHGMSFDLDKPWKTVARQILDIARRICRETAKRSQLGHDFTKLQSRLSQNEITEPRDFVRTFLNLMVDCTLSPKKGMSPNEDRMVIQRIYLSTEKALSHLVPDILSPFTKILKDLDSNSSSNIVITSPPILKLTESTTPTISCETKNLKISLSPESSSRKKIKNKDSENTIQKDPIAQEFSPTRLLRKRN